MQQSDVTQDQGKKVQGDQFKAMKAKQGGSKQSQGEKFRALKAKEAAKRAARLGAQVILVPGQ